MKNNIENIENIDNNLIIRKIKTNEYGLLEDFLYKPIFVKEGMQKPPKEIIYQEELQVYIKDFGASSDNCIVAEIFLDCDKDNIASSKTIRALGGKLLKEYFDDENVHCMVEAYVIDVNDALINFS